MAVEDGVCLGYFLRGAGPSDLDGRLVAFTRYRAAKTASVVRQSRALGALGQWKNPVLRWGRDFAMSVIAGPAFKLSAGRIGRFDEPAAPSA